MDRPYRVPGTDDRCCGACKCFTHEDIYGIGYCFLDNSVRYCGEACSAFINNENE